MREARKALLDQQEQDRLAQYEGPKSLAEVVLRQRGIWQKPVHLRWYGRPLLQTKCLALLDEIEERPSAPWTPAGLRACIERIPLDQRKGLVLHQREFVLWAVAAMRCARIALAAVEVEEGTKTVADLEGRIAQQLDGTVPLDPITCRPFTIEHGDDGTVIYGTDHDVPPPGGALGAAPPDEDRRWELWCMQLLWSIE